MDDCISITFFIIYINDYVLMGYIHYKILVMTSLSYIHVTLPIIGSIGHGQY